MIEPFDRTLCKEIEKAISTSGLNLTPNNDGNIIRINIPPLTEERRKELVKQVRFIPELWKQLLILCTQAKSISEDGKVAVRNVRREMVDKIKVGALTLYQFVYMNICMYACMYRLGGGKGQVDQQG